MVVLSSFKPHKKTIRCMSCSKQFNSPDAVRVRLCNICKRRKSNYQYAKYS